MLRQPGRVEQQEPMARVKITRRVHFSAAHRLGREDWAAERNAAVFGECAHANWHGQPRNYVEYDGE
jgi:hypothetical protein